MCGICGVISTNVGKQERNLFHNLLLLNYFRGEDSTGVVRVEEDTIRSHRTLSASPEFLFSDKAQELIMEDGPKSGEYAKPFGFIGHCRAATKGSVNVKNAHPFSFENIIGVHNGTLKSSFKDSYRFDTDSEGIYSLMNNTTDVKEVINEINKHDNAYVLVWVDSRDGSINIIKNSQRTLWMTFIYGRTTLVFSSDKSHLKLALAKMGIQTVSGIDPKDTLDTTAFFQLKPHVHFKTFIGKPVTSFEVTDLEIEEKKAPVYTYSASNYQHVGSSFEGKSSGKTLYRGPDGTYRDKDSHWEYMRKINAPQAKAPATQEAKPGGYQNFHQKEGGKLQDLSWLNKPLPKAKESSNPNSPGSIGVPVSNKELAHKLGCGCFHCGTKVSLDEYLKTKDTSEPAAHWYFRDYYACHTCYDNSPGDWIKYAINDEQATDGVPAGVEVH